MGRQGELGKWLDRYEREDRLGKRIARMRVLNEQVRKELGMPPRSPDAFPENRLNQDRSGD